MLLQQRELNAVLKAVQQSSLIEQDDMTVIEHYRAAKQLAKSIQIGFIALFFLLGAIAAPISFATDTLNQLNTFWLLLILLGTHFLSLFIWGVSLFKKSVLSPTQSSWFALVFQKIATKLQLPAPIIEGYVLLHFSHSVRQWNIARLLHCCWASYLIGGLLSALLFLMTHQVQFIWETTLLTQQDFYSLTQFISTIPSALGLPVPNELDIQLSQSGSLLQPDGTRKIWAIWILSCVLLYGVLLRIGLALLSHLAYRFKRNKLWQSLTSTIQVKTHVKTEVLDAAPADNATHVHPHSTSRIRFSDGHINEQTLFLFEWSKLIPSTLKEKTVEMLNNSTQQQSYLNQLAKHRAIIIDADTSPDRGSLRFLTSANASTESFYLYGGGFTDVWYQSLTEHGIESQKIIHLRE